MTRGFSLVELLVALTICALVSAAAAALVPPARAVFETTPAEIELQQRGRTTTEMMAQAIRAAGADVIATEGFGPLSGVVPAVVPSDIVDGRFTRLTVVAPGIDAAQGVLDRHQSDSTGPLPLGSLRCPRLSAVCGFSRNMTALIADGSGRFDAFTVTAADPATYQISASRALNPPYAAGSFVVEADVFTYQLELQPDRSQTLVRVTSAGAVQPIADRVTALAFELFAFDESGALTSMPVAALTDGPWLSRNPEDPFDEDVFRIRRVDVMLTMQATPPARTERSFRFGVFLRNAP